MEEQPQVHLFASILEGSTIAFEDTSVSGASPNVHIRAVIQEELPSGPVQATLKLEAQVLSMQVELDVP